MRNALLAVVPALICAAPVWAQTSATGPRWETRYADTGTRPLSGTELFRVGKDAMASTRAPGIHFAVRITRTNETFVCDTLPYTLRWDTTKAPEGWHWLEIVMVDLASDKPEQVIDSLKVYVRNNAATPMPAPPTESASALPVPALPAGEPVREAVPLASRRTTGIRVARMARAVTLPEAAPMISIDASIADSDNPLAVPRATALCKAGDKLYLGLPDGGVAIWDEGAKKGRVVRPRELTGPVRALAAGEDAVYWAVSGSDRIFRFREKDRSVCAFDAAEQAAMPSTSGETLSAGGPVPRGPRAEQYTPLRQATWIERLAVLGKRVVLMGPAATRFLEPDGTLKTVAEELPASVAENYSDGLVQCYVGAVGGVRDALLLFATPDASGVGGSLHLWTGNAQNPRDDWHERGMVPTAGNLTGTEATKLPPVLTPFGFATPERLMGSYRVSGVQFAALMDKDTPANPVTIPLGVAGEGNANAPQGADRLSCGGSGVWWTQSGIVFHADPFSSKRECYVPWNGAGGTVTAMLADKEGAYVATEKGIRRVVPGSPTEEDGYGGYVRVPLGDEYATPQTDRDKTLLANIETWQGVPYKWGGQTMSGTDCSGFVGQMHRSLGVAIPRTSSEMGTTRQGRRVRDELRYGDTLVFPGHVALYIGNGRTAETVGGTGVGSVGKASIWRRRDVVVKRFLPQP